MFFFFSSLSLVFPLSVKKNSFRFIYQDVRLGRGDLVDPAAAFFFLSSFNLSINSLG